MLKLFSFNEGEIIYYIDVLPNSNNDIEKILDILSCYGKYEIYDESRYSQEYVEIGPRNNFRTAWSNIILEIFKKCNINSVKNIEYSKKYYYMSSHIIHKEYDEMLYKEYNNDFTFNSDKVIDMTMKVNDIEKFNVENSLGFDFFDLQIYKELFDREPTNVELFDLSQCNSEHARHWFFNAIFNIDGEIIDNSLFKQIKSCYNEKKHISSLVSFKDNASVIKGSLTYLFNSNQIGLYGNRLEEINFSYKAETHNFPTGISPFPGAGTGSGGRIRDVIAVGRGGDIIAGTAGYCVGELLFKNDVDYSFLYNTPKKILIEASNGASDYGNKIGEPLIMGFVRSFSGEFVNCNDYSSNRIEWLKPIMFSGGIGRVLNNNTIKGKVKEGNIIVRIGGPAYRIGIGGGSASSRSQDNKNKESDFNAVQRGDPEMANKVVRVVRRMIEMNIPIISIHDQGSGGMANVTKEICDEMGADVFIDRILCGDNSLSNLEKWVAEYQEQITMVIEKIHLFNLKEIAKRENVSCIDIGEINNSGIISVRTNNDTIDEIVRLPTKDIESRKTFYLSKKELPTFRLKSSDMFYKSMGITLKNMYKYIEAGSKQFLTNKVDRSVSGLVVQQQCVGPFHLPLSNLSAVKQDFSSKCMLVSAIGEQPIKGIKNLDCIRKMVRMSVGEMISNIMWCDINYLEDINSVANWMWSSTNAEGGYLLYEAVNTLKECSDKLGFSINGGKDSLSMNVKNNEEVINAPNSLVISGYVVSKDIYSIVTPNLKYNNSILFYINFNGKVKGLLGGSLFERLYNMDFIVPDLEDFALVRAIFYKIQILIKRNIILSGHDVSDGGLINTLCEMAYSSGIGMDIDINDNLEAIEFFFNEELGIVFEIEYSNIKYVTELLEANEIMYYMLGGTNDSQTINIIYNNELILKENVDELRFEWQKTSYYLEKEQCNKKCVDEEVSNMYSPINNILPFKSFINDNVVSSINRKDKVCILREEGTNGDRELAYAFHEAGFNCYDVKLDDILNGEIELKDFRGIAFPGGFSYSDVLGSSMGWYSVIRNNEKIRMELDDFYKREDTFSIGICNGCQLMSLLEWIPKGITLEENISRRFESRWSYVKIVNDENIFFKGMKGEVLGVWSAHGEGRMVKNESFDGAVKYVDFSKNITEKYPFNPNGSQGGNCGVVSKNGRHLAIMPHPERTIMDWQYPTINYQEFKYSMWFKVFKNLYDWCN